MNAPGNEQRRPGGGGAAVGLVMRQGKYTSVDSLAQAALGHAARGWPVFPCHPRGKKPLAYLAPSGVKAATIDLETVARWWRACPTANIGLACGPSFWALDVDGDKGGYEALAALKATHGGLPATVAAATGSGGRHLLFKPNPRIKNWSNRGGPGIDTRSTGGYIVAPPSVHPNGQQYRWVPGYGPNELAVAEAPAWLLDLLDPPRPEPGPVVAFVPSSTRAATRYAERAFEAELERVAFAGPGERNHALNRAAYSLGQLAGAGLLDANEVATALAGAALAVGLDRREIEKTLASGLRTGMASPRGATQ